MGSGPTLSRHAVSISTAADLPSISMEMTNRKSVFFRARIPSTPCRAPDLTLTRSPHFKLRIGFDANGALHDLAYIFDLTVGNTRGAPRRSDNGKYSRGTQDLEPAVEP